MRLELSAREKRFLRAALAVLGVAHLLVPGLLLRVARAAYDRGLDVRFVARGAASRRVRLVGFVMVAVAAVWRRLARV
ncbi:hypothetical protein ACFPYI_08430 [Halomarina salina]|uniref:Uncharacterized protein n=1 Tax=Halomarina salina TaxID=1872699 RepID=A0ABD5RL32_9EURY|nr:hypothetical protein [Halomarina salina]